MRCTRCPTCGAASTEATAADAARCGDREGGSALVRSGAGRRRLGVGLGSNPGVARPVRDGPFVVGGALAVPGACSNMPKNSVADASIDSRANLPGRCRASARQTVPAVYSNICDNRRRSLDLIGPADVGWSAQVRSVVSAGRRGIADHVVSGRCCRPLRPTPRIPARFTSRGRATPGSSRAPRRASSRCRGPGRTRSRRAAGRTAWRSTSSHQRAEVRSGLPTCSRPRRGTGSRR